MISGVCYLVGGDGRGDNGTDELAKIVYMYGMLVEGTW